jgi:putative transposase
MLIHKGFKYRLYPTPEQESQLLQQAGNTRFLWNKLLESNIKTYETTKKFQFSHEMIVSIPKLKEEFDFLKLSFSQSLQQVGRQLDKALKDFLNPKLDREFPVFKKRRNRDSFTVPQKFACNKNNVKLPKIGKVKWIRHRNWEGSPKFLTVSRDGNQWYCSVTCEVNLPDKQLPDIETCKDNIAGIDVGLKEFATISDNTVIPNPRHLNKKLEKLKREQRWLSRKTKGSNNRKKQIEKVQTVHRKVRNTRKDFLHKVTSNMIAKYSGVVLEDLNVSGMMKNKKLSRHISDVGWYEFARQLEYKSLWNARHFIKIDRWYASSKICNECGSKKVDLKLSDRIYVCEDCGNIVDRDFNASKNILAEGLNVLLTTVGHTGSNACGDDKVHVFPVKEKQVIVREAGKRITPVVS